MRWSLEEDEYLREHYGKLSYRAMALVLGRTFEATKSRCYSIGLRTGSMAHNVSDNARMQRWREELYGR